MLRNRKGWMPPVLPHKHFFFLPDFFLLCLSSQLLHKKRHCVFHMDRVTTNSLKNQKYQAAGSVNGSVQVCENTSCCVGYFQVLNSQPVVHFLGKKTFLLLKKSVFKLAQGLTFVSFFFFCSLRCSRDVLSRCHLQDTHVVEVELH